MSFLRPIGTRRSCTIIGSVLELNRVPLGELLLAIQSVFVGCEVVVHGPDGQ